MTTANSRHYAEIVEALRAAGCGILRKPLVIPPAPVPVALPETRGKRDLETIRDTVAAICQIDVETLMGVRRAKEICRARHIFYFVARDLNGSSLPKIAAYCGKRDHSTVLHGVQKVQHDRAAFEPELSKVLRHLTKGVRV